MAFVVAVAVIAVAVAVAVAAAAAAAGVVVVVVVVVAGVVVVVHVHSAGNLVPVFVPVIFLCHLARPSGHLGGRGVKMTTLSCSVGHLAPLARLRSLPL